MMAILEKMKVKDKMRLPDIPMLSSRLIENGRYTRLDNGGEIEGQLWEVHGCLRVWNGEQWFEIEM